MKRKHIPLLTKLASALLALGHIPRADAKLMTPDQLVSLYNFDHIELFSLTANDHFSNLDPKLLVPHREKSKTDTSIAAKTKRLSTEQEAFVRTVLSRECGQKREPRSKIQNRGFPKKPRKERIPIPERRK